MLSPARRTLAPVVSFLALTLMTGACNGDSGSGSSTTTTEADGDTTTTTALTGVLTPTEAVIAGQCLDPVPDPAQQTVAVLVIPCEDHHTFEIYAQTKLDTGTPLASNAPYPGASTVANAAERQCHDAFDEFMGSTWEESEYDIQAWWPSESSWATKKDRNILCGVYRVTGGTTKGSVRGSGR